jgi:uncharacterized protein (TIRG00374 family)
LTSGKSNISTIKKAVGYFLPFALMIIFLYFAFKDVDIEKSIDRIASLSIPWLIAFLVVFLLSHFLRAVRWKYILNSVKPDVQIKNLFAATMIGYGVNCVVPRLGELYRALFLGRWENLSRSSMLGTIIVERVVDIIGLFFAVLLSIMIFPGNLLEEISWLKSALTIVFGGILALIFFIILLVRYKEKFYNGILLFVGKLSKNIAEKLGYVFHMLTDGFASLSGRKNYFVTIALTVVILVVYGLNSLLGFYLVRLDEIQPVTFSMAWISMTILAFGIIIPTPGGTGSYHAITILVLVTIFKFTNEAAAAYAILTHLISTVVFILSTFLSVYFVNRIRAKNGMSVETFFTVLKLKAESK